MDDWAPRARTPRDGSFKNGDRARFAALGAGCTVGHNAGAAGKHPMDAITAL